MESWNDIAIVIRAVYGKREECLERLTKQLSGFGLGYSVVYQDPALTYRQGYAFALAKGAATGKGWVLHLEDDAILRSDFATEALRLLSLGRDLPLVSMYSGKRVGEEQPPKVAVLERLPGSRFLMAQAYFMRADVVEDHNRFVLELVDKHKCGADIATAAWMKARKYRYARAWPSIVQHDDVPSLCGHHRNPNRFAGSYSER